MEEAMDGFRIKHMKQNILPLSLFDPAQIHNTGETTGTSENERITIGSDKKDVKKIVEQAQKAVHTINQKLELINTKIVIDRDQETGKTIFKIVNAESGEVIKQVPPETLLKISAHISEYMNSLHDELKDKQIDRVI
jgi:uncharacterized FlaG/YvyC family protein